MKKLIILPIFLLTCLLNARCAEEGSAPNTPRRARNHSEMSNDTPETPMTPTSPEMYPAEDSLVRQQGAPLSPRTPENNPEVVRRMQEEIQHGPRRRLSIPSPIDPDSSDEESTTPTPQTPRRARGYYEIAPHTPENNPEIVGRMSYEIQHGPKQRISPSSEYNGSSSEEESSDNEEI